MKAPTDRDSLRIGDWRAHKYEDLISNGPFINLGSLFRRFSSEQRQDLKNDVEKNRQVLLDNIFFITAYFVENGFLSLSSSLFLSLPLSFSLFLSLSPSPSFSFSISLWSNKEGEEENLSLNESCFKLKREKNQEGFLISTLTLWCVFRKCNERNLIDSSVFLALYLSLECHSSFSALPIDNRRFRQATQKKPNTSLKEFLYVGLTSNSRKISQCC